MSVLSNILIDEHKTIINLFKELENEEANSENRRIKFALVQFALFEHLKKEDLHLYPKLVELEKSKIIGAEFSKEMLAITKEIEAFFAKYKGGSYGMEFAKEIGTIIAKLKQRILKEEEVLLPNYESQVV